MTTEEKIPSYLYENGSMQPKEVEVLDDSDVDFALIDFKDKSPLQYFSDYLKANNLLIVKIKD